jgi:RimJ/RimL family protein N-acetyltransferase
MKDDILTFKRWETSDIDNLVRAIRSTPNLEQWVPWAIPGYTYADGQKWIDICQNAWKKFRCFAVYKEDRLVGSVSVNRVNIHTGEVGYWVAEEFRRQGLCQRMFNAAAAYAFENLNQEQVILKIATDNVISQKAAEKFGAEKVRLEVGGMVLNERKVDAFIYQMDRPNK